MSSDRRGRFTLSSRGLLPLALAALAGLLAVLDGFNRSGGQVQGATAGQPDASARRIGLQEPGSASAAELTPGGTNRRTSPVPELGTRAAHEGAPATISGRLVIDGFAPSRARVHLEAAEAGWEHWLAVDRYGRFYLQGAPPGELALSFEAESLFERQLLLPNVLTVHARPGETEVVDLAWTTRQVNVQIGVPDELVGPVQVELTGPSYRTTFVTNERGRARLSLVGNGTFSFRAELPTGRQAEASQMLEESDELETIVLRVAPLLPG